MSKSDPSRLLCRRPGPSPDLWRFDYPDGTMALSAILPGVVERTEAERLLAFHLNHDVPPVPLGMVEEGDELRFIFPHPHDAAERVDMRWSRTDSCEDLLVMLRAPRSIPLMIPINPGSVHLPFGDWTVLGGVRRSRPTAALFRALARAADQAAEPAFPKILWRFFARHVNAHLEDPIVSGRSDPMVLAALTRVDADAIERVRGILEDVLRASPGATATQEDIVLDIRLPARPEEPPGVLLLQGTVDTRPLDAVLRHLVLCHGFHGLRARSGGLGPDHILSAHVGPVDITLCVPPPSVQETAAARRRLRAGPGEFVAPGLRLPH